jgi:outer membrane protein assembly factor BamB
MYPLPLDWPTAWSNVISDRGVIYLRAAFRARGAKSDAARVIALSARDGVALWQTDLPELQEPPVLAVEGERVIAVGIVDKRAAIALDAQTAAIRWMRPNLRGGASGSTRHGMSWSAGRRSRSISICPRIEGPTSPWPSRHSMERSI